MLPLHPPPGTCEGLPHLHGAAKCLTELFTLGKKLKGLGEAAAGNSQARLDSKAF